MAREQFIDAVKKKFASRLIRKRNKSMDQGTRIRGTVTARRCKHCGHHEIGLITQGGRYVPLSPGMKVEIVGK